MKKKSAMEEAAGLGQQLPERRVKAWETAEGVVEARAFQSRGNKWREVGHFVENPAIQERIRGKTVYLSIPEGVEKAQDPRGGGNLYVVEKVEQGTVHYVEWTLDRSTTELARNLERNLRKNTLIPLKQVSPRKKKLLEDTFPGITLPPTQP